MKHVIALIALTLTLSANSAGLRSSTPMGNGVMKNKHDTVKNSVNQRSGRQPTSTDGFGSHNGHHSGRHPTRPRQ